MYQVDLCCAENPAIENKNGNGNQFSDVRNSRTQRGSSNVLVGLFGVSFILNVLLVVVLITDVKNIEQRDEKDDHNITTEQKGKLQSQVCPYVPTKLCGTANIRFAYSIRLFNSKETTPGDFPWMALLLDSGGNVLCAGSLISERYVLTAAHCVHLVNTVRLGEHDTNSILDCVDEDKKVCAPPVQDFSVTSNDITKHPYYSAAKRYNDIALIRLPKAANLSNNYVSPICLPHGELWNVNDGQPGDQMTISGWGQTEDGATSNTLRFASVQLKSTRECGRLYKNISSNVVFDERNVCAAGIEEQNHCEGDSGGPLQFTKDIDGVTVTVIYGVMALGDGHCTSNSLPGTYTKVSYYIDWILNNMKE